MAITNQAEADAYIKASNENKTLSEQYYNAFKQTVTNSNAQYDIIQSQLTPLKDDSTIEGLQKKIELRKNLAEILSASIADSKTYFMQMNDLSSAGYGQTDNRPVYLKNMADNIKLQQAAIDSNDKKIAALETKLNEVSGKQSATEEETAKAKAAEEAAKPPPPANVDDPTKKSGVVDDEQGVPKEDVKAGLKTNEVTSPDVGKNTTAVANKSNKSEVKPNNSVTAGVTNSAVEGLIGARTHNPLSKIADYTYNLTLAYASPDSYNRWVEGDKSAVANAPVIIRSGGTNKKRAPGFELDVFMDELEIDTRISSKEQGSATNSVGFKFKIFEPFGFSVPNSLAKLRDKGYVGLESFRGVFFLTVKFYGWGTTNFENEGTTNTPPELHERTFGIDIIKVNFKLDRGLVVYEVSAVQAQNKVAQGNKGEIKVNKTVQGVSVYDLLAGGGKNSTKETFSLVDALNKEEQEAVRNGKAEVANVYKIKILDDDIANAELIPGQVWAKGKSPMAPIDNSAQVNSQLSFNNDTKFTNKKMKQVTFTAGTPIVKAIDNIIGQSSYVRNALTGTKEEEEIDPNNPKTNINKNPNKKLSWYNITPVIKFKTTGTGPDGKDKYRNDYAYEITYIVQRYEVPYLKSVYADKTEKYYGPYKRYQYWYTGQNTEVLSFDINYDYAYQVDTPADSVSTKVKDVPAALGGTAIAVKPASADKSGRSEGTNEESNSIRSWLYSPGDTVKWNLAILGDPDYLMPPHTGSVVEQMLNWYGEDFAINPGVGQVFIEIDFKQASDYDKNTGLLKTDDKIKFMDYPSEMNPQPKGFVFYVVKVVSTFSRGRFEQRLSGGLPNFSEATKHDLNGNKVATTEDAEPVRSAGYNSFGTNNGVDNGESLMGPVAQGSSGNNTTVQNQPVTGVQQPAQSAMNVASANFPTQDTTVTKNANDDQSGSNSSPVLVTTDEGGREPEYKADVAFGKSYTPAVPRNAILPTLG